jgi:hypothetical protein
LLLLESQCDAQFSAGSGSEVKRQRMSDDADYQPPGHGRSSAAAAAAGGVAGDSDSAGSYRAAQPHIASAAGVEQQLLRLQSQQGAALAADQQYGGDLSRLLELQHASSYATSLGAGAGNANLAAVMAAANAAAVAAAAAAATETTGTSKDDGSEEERVRRRREINRNSQKRIRERRNKEMESVKHEVR